MYIARRRVPLLYLSSAVRSIMETSLQRTPVLLLPPAADWPSPCSASGLASSKMPSLEMSALAAVSLGKEVLPPDLFSALLGVFREEACFFRGFFCRIAERGSRSESLSRCDDAPSPGGDAAAGTAAGFPTKASRDDCFRPAADLG